MAASTQTEREIKELNLALLDRARHGKWGQFGQLLQQRDRLLEALPAARRRQVFEATIEANAAILTHACADRETTLERLNGVRQKRSVTSYYRNHGGARTD